MKTLKKKFKEYDKLLDIIKNVIGDKSENINNCIDKLEIEESLKLINEIVEGC